MTRNGEKKTQKQKSLPFIQPDAAGIDIGATEIYVAVPEERDNRPVRKFATFTEELHRLADWLIACSIKTVAIESTGVYWIALFQILERRGLEVCLVNARHVKGVPGRKTDIQDCQWLQYLHSVGLLATRLFPARGGRLRGSQHFAPSRHPAQERFAPSASHAKGPHPDEPSSRHFASWLGLCPDNRISGGKILSSKTRNVRCRLANALRMAATTLYRKPLRAG